VSLSIPIPVYFLVAAALLGFVIGWFFNRISSIRAYNQLATESETRLRRLNRRMRALNDDNTLLEASMEESRMQLQAHEDLATDTTRDEHKSVAELKQKEQRINELESLVYTNEEQHMRLQRDFAKFRLVKTREVQQLQQQVVAAGGTAAAVAAINLSDEVPVLNKKATTEDKKPTESEASGLPDVTHGVLESEEDLMEMTSEFHFDPEELLADD